jgi:putative hemolysin
LDPSASLGLFLYLYEMPKFIDIEKIFKDKNPGAYKWIPSFLINYIKKIVHEDRINRFVARSENLHEFDYLDAALKEVGANITFTGLENIPQDGNIIVASNHPLGGLDGMALLQVIGKRRKDIQFLVNDILTNLKNFGRLFVPVNKVGVNATDNLRRIEEIYAGNGGVVVFPAGLVSREQEGVIKDLEWSKSFITRAQKYDRVVVPTFIKGKLSNRFYNLSKWRKRFGIKANIEMLYLADEMFLQEGASIHITFGPPIAPSVFVKSKNPKLWAQELKDYVYTLEKDNIL